MENFGAIEDPTAEMDTEITDTDLDEATKEHLKIASATLNNSTKKKRKKK